MWVHNILILEDTISSPWGSPLSRGGWCARARAIFLLVDRFSIRRLFIYTLILYFRYRSIHPWIEIFFLVRMKLDYLGQCKFIGRNKHKAENDCVCLNRTVWSKYKNNVSLEDRHTCKIHANWQQGFWFNDFLGIPWDHLFNLYK